MLYRVTNQFLQLTALTLHEISSVEYRKQHLVPILAGDAQYRVKRPINQ